jgi:hypothetical protein
MGFLQILWDETRDVVLRRIRVVILLFDHLPGGKGIVREWLDSPLLEIGFPGLELEICVHIYSFWRIKKGGVHPKWDERRCVRGATQLRLDPVLLAKIPVVMQREASLTLRLAGRMMCHSSK